MLCNRKKSSPCLFLLVALLGAILAGCGGDEPAPAPPPPPPPPPPAFVPKDVSIELGTSGETLTLQTTESGGFTRNGEAFASGTTVEAAGNTYRLVLADGEWAAEYVAPRPWATALGRSGDALLITRREDGLYEVGEGDDAKVFSSGGTLTASNGNEYRLTLNMETNAWQVEYLPPEPAAVLLGMSGETVLVERLEGGGYSVGGQRVVDGSTVESASGSRYRLSMQDGAWTATFVPPPPVSVQLGTSGQTVTLQIGEDGNYYKGEQMYASGSTEQTADGTIYTLTLQNGMWSASVMSEPVVVSLGASGASVTLQRVRTADGVRFEKDGRPFETGSTESAGGNTYRLVLQNGEWSAEYVPRTVVVALGTTGETVILRQMTEDGSRFETQDGRTYASGTTETTTDGTRFSVVLRNGVWDAIADRGQTIRVRLGERGGTITLRGYSNGDLTFEGAPFTSGRAITSPENGSEYIVTVEQQDDGTWDAVGRFRPQSERVRGADGQLLLFRQEDGSYIDANGDRVRNGDTITYKGERYELLESATQGWIATPVGSVPTARDQVVTLPNNAGTITLTRNEDDDFEYEGQVVRSGEERTVGGVRYRLTQDSDGRWSAAAVRDTSTIDTGGIGGPTQTDEKKDFTEALFDGGTAGLYGVGFLSRDGQTTVDERGTHIVPLRLEGTDVSNRHKFPVYDLMRQSLVSQKRTAAQVAKAELEEIIARITLRKPLYAASAAYPDRDIEDDGMLWDQAEDAVARIFGWVRTETDDTEHVEGILGRTPWNGRLDPDEVDDVITTLQDVVATLSDVDRFAREFEDEIDDANGTATSYDADDFFGSVSSRIRFGSTGGTRFGAYAVTDAGEPAASTMWDTGVFAYTPDKAPTDDDIPLRGAATFRGDTVAVADGSSGTTAATAPKLYAGKIELTASFSKGQVSGTITELKDEDGRALEATSSDSFRKETVRSITLPDATASDDGEGFYEVEAGDATVSFVRNLRSEEAPSTVRVQLLGEASEALGIWTAADSGLDLSLEGSFGATRSGSVTAPRLPRVSDDGGVVSATSRIFLPTTPTPTISTDDPDDENTITLDNTLLGMAHTDAGGKSLIDWYDDYPDEWSDDLEDLHPTRNVTVRGDLYVATAKAEINRLRNLLNTSSERTRYNAQELTTRIGGEDVTVDSSYLSGAVEAALTLVFGASPPGLTGSTTGQELYDSLTLMYNALNSERVFRSAVDTDGVFASEDDRTADEVSDMFDARDVALALRFASTEYTRFGVWSESAPISAVGALSGNTIAHGAFGYSPMDPETTTLTFVADYEGKTLAVDGSNGNLYSGTFELTVNWGDADDEDNISARIINLKGVHGTTKYFQHDNKDVGTIFMSGIDIDGDTTAEFSVADAAVRFVYRDTSAAEGTGTAGVAGKFVGDDHSEGPLGVLGTWTIGDTATGFKGAFGADLQP